ncbi:class I SAM-dependent methyltransferase [aff. Roholtiella sp. LEGE 12411]|uniref:class I SAM-dependent methyltransferase n=1 Tax=aff. Roholtiella sp. LEGE 12411 TaxID=1828822 RepID=UPI00188057D0|nr:class I SAM-dependent methyltransferase [aff. Roholtiella sp. LEGE 12411]MBE9035773.1 class I SAM-dependent methyltransferase [aff. Roholtiella sp. LEGE 12411]
MSKDSILHPIKSFLNHLSFNLQYELMLLSFRGKNRKEVFNDIYYRNRWGDRESVSGRGSNIQQTLVILKKLPALLEKLNIKTMLDAPCGDFYWLKEAQLNLEKYIGCDIVADLITDNQRLYGNETRDFIAIDLATDTLPQVDLIFCRDCLVHLSFKDALAVIKNFKKSNSQYLLTTTYPGILENKDIVTGDWRAIDLQLPPYKFPDMLEIIDEETTERQDYKQKSLGLWKLSDIGNRE